MASPDKVGKKREGKEFEDRGHADQGAGQDIPAAQPTGPAGREQEEEYRIHGPGEHGVGQRKEGRQHGHNGEHLRSARHSDRPVDHHQAGKDRRLDQEQPDSDGEVVRYPGQRDQRYGECGRIQVPATQGPVPGHMVVDEVRVGVAARRDLLGGEQVVLEVIGARRLGGQQGQKEARGVERQQDPDQAAEGNLARIGPAQQSPHGHITRGERQVTPAVTWPLQRIEEPDGRFPQPLAGDCVGSDGRRR